MYISLRRKYSPRDLFIIPPSLCVKIIVNLDVMMARRKMSLNELSVRVGITVANLSILKTGKAKAVRFSTLDAICRALNCTPRDILEYRNEL